MVILHAYDVDLPDDTHYMSLPIFLIILIALHAKSRPLRGTIGRLAGRMRCWGSRRSRWQALHPVHEVIVDVVRHVSLHLRRCPQPPMRLRRQVLEICLAAAAIMEQHGTEGLAWTARVSMERKG